MVINDINMIFLRVSDLFWRDLFDQCSGVPIHRPMINYSAPLRRQLIHTLHYKHLMPVAYKQLQFYMTLVSKRQQMKTGTVIRTRR